jgi:hypothetical protein
VSEREKLFCVLCKIDFAIPSNVAILKKGMFSESVTGHQLDTSAASKFSTMSTESFLVIGLRVLIVEDHLANRILLQAMLNKRSNQDVCYEIETVEDG